MHGKQTNNVHKYTIQSKLAKNVPTQLQIKQLTMLDEIHVTTDRRSNARENNFVVIWVRRQTNNFNLQVILNHRPHVHILMEETL